MAQYQSFPDTGGDSRSLDKLKALQLPVLEGKSFLDVGCNEGFFCGFAKFAGAARAVGIDNNNEFVRRAASRFPDCEFQARSWDDLPDDSFDVILLASALHYAEDQAALIRKLVDRLTADGTLVLELGIARSDKAEWITVKRGIDRRQFPSMPMLSGVLDDFAWKWMGPSVMQSGDPIPRHVVHVSRRRPVAYLLMQPPASGKSSIARRLFANASVDVVSGDAVLLELAYKHRDASPKLRKLVAKDFSAQAVDQATRRVFDAGLGAELVQAWLAGVHGRDVAVDAFVPSEWHELVVAELTKGGYLPVNLTWQRPAGRLLSRSALVKQADRFYRSLGKEPPLIANEPAPVRSVGYVDNLSVTPECIVVRGWAVDENGNFPSQLVVGVGTDRTVVDTGSSLERKDVQRHLEWEHAQVGYSIMLAGVGVVTAKELGRRGFSLALMSGKELRCSPAVKALLADGVTLPDVDAQ